MLVTIGMNGALAGPSSHFELSGVFDLSDLELCEVYCIVNVANNRLVIGLPWSTDLWPLPQNFKPLNKIKNYWRFKTKPIKVGPVQEIWTGKNPDEIKTLNHSSHTPVAQTMIAMLKTPVKTIQDWLKYKLKVCTLVWEFFSCLSRRVGQTLGYFVPCYGSTHSPRPL